MDAPDPRGEVLDPFDRHLVDPKPAALGEHKQLRVEEPLLIEDERHELSGNVGPDRLEAPVVAEHDLCAAWIGGCQCGAHLMLRLTGNAGGFGVGARGCEDAERPDRDAGERTR
jgi:hypothetical protein